MEQVLAQGLASAVALGRASRPGLERGSENNDISTEFVLTSSPQAQPELALVLEQAVVAAVVAGPGPVGLVQQLALP